MTMSLSLRKQLAIICLCLLLNSSLSVEANVADKQSILSALTLNIARFTTWPKNTFDAHNATINLCVIGDNTVQESFLKMTNKRINGKTLHISDHSRLRNLSTCQIIYISGLSQSTLHQVLLNLKSLPILTVGENLNFIHAGGMVSLEKKSEKMQLLINLPISKRANLVISSRILKLATIFYTPP